MKKRFHRLRRIIEQNRFLVVLVGAIAIAVLLTSISLTIYVRDGSILLDLSRPSYAPVRDKIKKDDNTPGFKADGKIDAAVVKDFRNQLKGKTDEIDQLGDFDAATINDEALQLAE